MFNQLSEANIENKKVIVRVDFNVPIKDGTITSDKRIRAAIPTINQILEKNPTQVILMSHLGKPKGKSNPELSLAPVAKRLSELLAREVATPKDCIEPITTEDKIVLLENLRFHAEEKENDASFAEKLSKHADIYINDAFGTCHRKHASTYGVTEFLPSYVGLLVEKEYDMIHGSMEHPHRPFIALVGCAKIADKIKMLKNILAKVDHMLIGGAIVFTFMKSQGVDVGRSLVDEDNLDLAKELLEEYKEKIILPTDVVISETSDGTSEIQVVDIDKIPENQVGLDIGPHSVELFKEYLKDAGTILWNGPMGKFETEAFGKATKAIGEYIAGLDAISIVGGGDTAAAAEKYNLQDKITHISTGGGASLELIEKGTLPCLEPLMKK